MRWTRSPGNKLRPCNSWTQISARSFPAFIVFVHHNKYIHTHHIHTCLLTLVVHRVPHRRLHFALLYASSSLVLVPSRTRVFGLVRRCVVYVYKFQTAIILWQMANGKWQRSHRLVLHPQPTSYRYTYNTNTSRSKGLCSASRRLVSSNSHVASWWAWRPLLYSTYKYLLLYPCHRCVAMRCIALCLPNSLFVRLFYILHWFLLLQLRKIQRQ